MALKTADLCDAHLELAICEPLFTSYGKKRRFSGPIATVKCHEDNSLVKEALGSPGEGRVLVVDGGGSKRCALLGDLLGAMAVKSGWAGLLVNGCVRDSADLSTLDLGVLALATHPLKSEKRGAGQRDLVVRFAGVAFAPGAYLYADEDGVVVSPRALAEP